jgi:hypothetical protein
MLHIYSISIVKAFTIFITFTFQIRNSLKQQSLTKTLLSNLVIAFSKEFKKRGLKVIYELFMSLRKWSRFLAISSFHVCSVYPWTSIPCFLAFCNTSSSVSPYLVCVHNGSPASLGRDTSAELDTGPNSEYDGSLMGYCWHYWNT